MHRLTFQTPDGRFGVDGIDLTKLDAKLYMCICKLKDYERAGLSPDGVEDLKDRDTAIAPKPDKRIPGIGKCQVCKTELRTDDDELFFCPKCGQRLKKDGERNG